MGTTLGVVMFMIVVSIIILAAIEMQSRRKAKTAAQQVDGDGGHSSIAAP